jgi:hypothetical protein
MERSRRKKRSYTWGGEGGEGGDAKSKRNHTVNLGQKEWRNRRILRGKQSHLGKGNCMMGQGTNNYKDTKP